MPGNVTADQETPAFTIRAYRPISEDAAAASAILRECKEGAPWSEGALGPSSFDLASMVAFFSEVARAPAGFIIGRRAADEGEILNLAVSSSSRRQGLAKALVHRILADFAKHSVVKVFLEVRESNSAAIALYEKLGFRRVGMRQGYYRDPSESALVYSKPLDSTG
jgi:[ribosomal protein S18]-alanine N-acetyltransferase